MDKNIFDGLKVIDLSTVLAGPSVGMFFAELGADVLKIEHPVHADVTRSWKLPDEDPNAKVSAYFSSINYLKQYASLDLANTQDRLKLDQHLSGADILITNFKRSDYKKFQLEHLHANFPRLVHGRISGYGVESDRVAYDLILQAESGFMSMNGTKESGPVKMPVALIDVLASHHLKEGILCKLLERERTGLGGEVTVSLLEAAISSLVNQASNYLMTGHVPERLGSLHPNIAPYGEIFKTLDNRLITFAIGSNQHFIKLCETIKRTELTHDERFITNQNRVQNRAVLFELLNDAVQKIDGLELLDELHRQNVPAGEIKGMDRVFEELEAQKLIREEEIDGVNTRRVTSIAFK